MFGSEFLQYFAIKHAFVNFNSQAGASDHVSLTCIKHSHRDHIPIKVQSFEIQQCEYTKISPKNPVAKECRGLGPSAQHIPTIITTLQIHLVNQLLMSHCHDDSVIATKNQTIRTKVLNMIPLPRRIVPVLQKIKLNKTTKTTTTSNQSQRCSQDSENKNSLAQLCFLACLITLKAGVCRRDFAEMRLDHQEFATSLSDSVSYRNYNNLTFPY